MAFHPRGAESTVVDGSTVKAGAFGLGPGSVGGAALPRSQPACSVLIDKMSKPRRIPICIRYRQGRERTTATSENSPTARRAPQGVMRTLILTNCVGSLPPSP